MVNYPMFFFQVVRHQVRAVQRELHSERLRDAGAQQDLPRGVFQVRDLLAAAAARRRVRAAGRRALLQGRQRLQPTATRREEDHAQRHHQRTTQRHHQRNVPTDGR